MAKRKRDRKLAERRRVVDRPGPVLTIVQYGPDDRTVTKVAASAVSRPGRGPDVIRRWVGTDITKDPTFRKELLDFVLGHHPRSVVLTQGVLGCVHEEGEDYPDGEECPFCPFWRGRDRWANARPVVITLDDLRNMDRWPGELDV